MPRRSSRCSSKISDEEDHILDKIKCQPNILESLDKVFTLGHKKQQLNYEKLATELNCTVDILKKVWSKIHPNDEMMKSVKDSTETRPRTARSNGIEPRETRRSLRSQSIDKTFWISPTVVYGNTDNSCASSSSCGSPKFEENHSLQQKQQSSRRNLDAINENDVSVESVDVELTQQRYTTGEADEEARNDDRSSSPEQVDAHASDIGANDHRQVASNAVLDDSEHIARASAVIKYLDEISSDDKNLRLLHFSDPMKTPRNSQTLHSSMSNYSHQLSVSESKEECQMSRRKLPNSDDSTRIFFDSISLTVMNFPQHLQASVKAQVSKIVHELEYELSSPAYINDNSIAVAS